MPYSENNQLPEPVRNSLSESDQTKWREVFNSALSGTCAGDDGCAARAAWSAVKKEARLIEGWASTDALDKQGDVVEPEAFERTMGRYMAQGGLLIDKHSNRKIGAVVDWALKEKEGKRGLWIKAVIYRQYAVQDEVWKRIQAGDYKAFSIGGDPLKIGRVCDEKQCWNTIKDLELYEISVVDRPANPEATIEAKTLAKTDTFINKSTTSQGSPMVVEATAGVEEKPTCHPLACLQLADAEVLKIVKHLKGGCVIDEKKEKGGEGAVASPPGVEDKKQEQAPTANPMEAILAALTEIKAMLAGQKKPEEKPTEESEEMKAEKTAKLIETKVAEAVKMELTKIAQAKEPATKRPTLEKHEPDGDEIEKALKDRDALREMSWEQAIELANKAGKGR